jgi:hypothetical protein
MTRNLVAIAAAATAALAAPALADVPGANWISSTKVTAMLAKQGYRVTKIEADDGHWEGEAVRKDARFDFHVDPQSGRITKMEPDRD